MEIKVLGGGCSSCSQMYDNARIAVDELGLDLEVEFIHDITKALQYEVLQMPALIIDEKAVSFGRDLSVDEIKEILKSIDNQLKEDENENRKIMLPLLAALMFGNGVVRAQNEAKHDKPAVEVVVFHGVKQCQTCQAIKKNSQEVAEELAADGKNVSYRVVDFSKPEGKDEAKKYEIAWTSLLLIRHDAGDKETVRNISKFAIENARTNTEKFRKQLAEDIGKLLKE